VKLGQTVLMRKPDNEPTGGQNKTRYIKYGLSKGTICGVYKHHILHHILIDFGAWKSSYRIADIRLGLEPYKEVIE
jgi:hypothetical protein